MAAKDAGDGGLLLPTQLALEVHTAFEPKQTIRRPTFGWVRHEAPPLPTFFQQLYRNASYLVVHRDDGLRSPGLSELVLMRGPVMCTPE